MNKEKLVMLEPLIWKYLSKQRVLTTEVGNVTADCKRIHFGILRIIRKVCKDKN